MNSHFSRRVLVQTLAAGAILPFSRLVRAEGDQEVFDWVSPPVGLRWSTRRRSEFSNGKIHHTREDFEIQSVEGDLVTYQHTSTDIDDGDARSFEKTSWRMWEEKSWRSLGSASATDVAHYNPGRLIGFWPWRIGSNWRYQHEDADYVYELKNFEDMDSGGFRGPCARIVATGTNGGVPALDNSLYAAKTAIRIQRSLKAGWREANGKVVTFAAEEQLNSWSIP